MIILMTERKIDIVALLPNPSGADSGGEWIELFAAEEVDVSQLSLELNSNGIKQIEAVGKVSGKFYLALNSEQTDLIGQTVFKQPLTLLNSASQVKLYLNGEPQQTFSYQETTDEMVTVYDPLQSIYKTVRSEYYWNSSPPAVEFSPIANTPPTPASETGALKNSVDNNLLAKQEFAKLLWLHQTPHVNITKENGGNNAVTIQTQSIDPHEFRTPTFVSSQYMTMPLSLLLVAMPLALVVHLLFYEVSLILRNHKAVQLLWQQIVYIYRLKFSAGQ